MSSGVDPGAVGDWLGAAKSAVDLLKAAVVLVPKGKDKDDLAASVAKAELALNRSDAALAKELGFQLCQCAFPPRIMLWKEGQRVFACPDPTCGSMKRPAQSAPVVVQPAKPINPAKQCPLCDAEMKVVAEHDDPIFGDFGHKLHKLECTCGNKADRRFVPGKGYS